MPTKILVADDSATMRRVMEMTFAGEDASVVTVDSGEAAVTKAAEITPDIVFADVSMGGVDGYEVARRIKTNPSLQKVAVIVVASQHHPYDDGKGRAAGVDDHISKPFDTQSVIDRVGQVLARPRVAAGVGAAAEAKPAAPAPKSPTAPAATAPTAPGRSAMQGTRMGLGVPVPIQPAPAAAKPPAAPPAAPLRPAATAPMLPVQPAKAAAAPAPQAVVSPRAAAPQAAVIAASADLAGKLNGLGLTKDQIEGVLALSREIIEQVVWEVVPDLAEQLIKEEIKRLTTD